jgi:hypothetical protein
MTLISPNPASRPADSAAIPTLTGKTAVGNGTAAAPASASAGVSTGVSISSLASRLSRAAGAGGAALSHQVLGDKVRANIERITYPLDAQHKAAAARQLPEPNDAASSASAQAANAFIDNPRSPNPFAGLSREQLSTIVNDESGTFTINEQRAAYRQAYDEEQKWREQVVAQAMQEYHETGKLTDFFKSVLEHFKGLPEAEQALYPADYGADLQDKIDLDFNYFTHTAGGQPGVTSAIERALGRQEPDKNT